MLKAFKISSYVILAVSIVLAAHIGISSFFSDSSVKNLLEAPGAYERCKEKANLSHSDMTAGQNPLVKQAKEFANRINPPEEVKKDKKASKKITQNRKPVKKTNLYKKFKLLGTAVNTSNPQKSMALIDLPGTGQKWVFQGETVNRVVIEGIYEDKIAIKEGSATKELILEVSESKVKQLLKESKPLEVKADNKEKLTPEKIANMVHDKLKNDAAVGKEAATHKKPVVHKKPATHEKREVVMTPQERAKKSAVVLKALENISKDKQGSDEQEKKRLEEVGEILKAFMLLDEKGKSPSTDKQ